MSDDPCECLWSHEAAMRRLLSMLRDSQQECTEGDCVGGPPGIAGNAQGMVMWSMLWGILALAVFFLGPRSRNGSQQGEPATKPPPSPPRSDDNQPPPGVN